MSAASVCTLCTCNNKAHSSPHSVAKLLLCQYLSVCMYVAIKGHCDIPLDLYYGELKYNLFLSDKTKLEVSVTYSNTIYKSLAVCVRV